MSTSITLLVTPGSKTRTWSVSTLKSDPGSPSGVAAPGFEAVRNSGDTSLRHLMLTVYWLGLESVTKNRAFWFSFTVGSVAGSLSQSCGNWRKSEIEIDGTTSSLVIVPRTYTSGPTMVAPEMSRVTAPPGFMSWRRAI